MKNYCLLLLTLLVASGATAQKNCTAWDTYSDTWVTADALGREVYSSDCRQTADAESEQPSSVGMFYYLWHNKHTKSGRPIFDITEMLKANPCHPQWGEDGEMHWWGKPVLGYYAAGDPFVIAKHLQMLCDAGVDFLYFDTTNAVIYDDVVEKVMTEVDRRTALGMKAPKLCFMIHSRAMDTAERLYKRFYKWAKYDKYWYEYAGKPLLLGDKVEVGATKEPGLMNRFTFRNSWAWMQGCKSDEWAWLENYPQAPGWSGTKDNVEQIVVCTAQHATTKIGKSYHNGTEPPLNKYAVCDSTGYGLFYAEQWMQAHRVHPPVLMITQFNEWIASRFDVKNPSEYWTTRPGAKEKVGEVSFVDTYNAEFNRDIEPCRDSTMRDNYYLQTVSNLRKYKGARNIPEPKRKYSIDVTKGMEQWAAVFPEFRDDRGDVLHQSTLGYNEMAPQQNDTGRNDIVVSKAAYDGKSICFYVETMNPIVGKDDMTGSWMTLLLNTDMDYSTGWNGYDFCVKRDGQNDGLALFRNVNGKYEWEKVADISYRLVANKMQLSIPLRLLPVKQDVDFKWIDNVPESPELDDLDFIVYGDVAPNGRFNYRFKLSSLKK